MLIPAVAAPKTKGVSGSRKAFSICVLLAALIVLGIELRAGIGQSRSAKQLASISTDGSFNNVLLADAHKMLLLSPNATVIRENRIEKVVHYRWGSLLRSLLGQAESDLFLVSSATEPPYAIAYFTDREDAQSGLFGDAALIEYSMEGTTLDNDNPLNLPDAPTEVTAPDAQSPDAQAPNSDTAGQN